jgi:hypothetical protein
MAAAKYYIYFNLHKHCYSVRYKGKVILHTTKIDCTGVTFSVSQKGRERVLKEKRKNVHAFIVAESIDTACINRFNTDLDCMVKYNPYKYSSFVTADESPIYQASYVALGTIVVFEKNRPYILAKV